MLLIARRHRYCSISFLFFGFCLFILFNYNFLKTNSSFEHILSNSTSILDCTGDPLKHWCKNAISYCNSSLILFNNLFVKTDSIILQPKLAKGKRRGGEDLQNVLNQNENDEYFHFDKGFLQLPCHISLSNQIFGNTHLSKVFSSLTFSNTNQNFHLINQTTIAINRYDYVNFYHTITDLYTIYLLCRFIRINPKTVQILFLDAHPKGNLDRFWSQLFHSYIRLGHLNTSSVFYRELLWSQPQSKSELDIKQSRRIAPSYFADFRQHILEEFHIDSKTNENINCQNINIFFLLRHNYVAHPRNPKGIIQRQLINENEILNDLKQKFQNFSTVHFTFNHFEELSIEEQLETIRKTDIFLGMHGAGLTHVMFLQQNRILIELASIVWNREIHFDLMASMNNINYHRCLIQNGHPTTGETIFNCITQKLFQICRF